MIALLLADEILRCHPIQLAGNNKRAFRFRNVKVVGFRPPSDVTAQTLMDVCTQVINRIETKPPVRRIVIDPQVNLQETISRLKERLMNKMTFQFQDLVKNAQSKTEVIVQFLAILELVKQHLAVISQQSDTHDINIVPVS